MNRWILTHRQGEVGETVIATADRMAWFDRLGRPVMPPTHWLVEIPNLS